MYTTSRYANEATRQLARRLAAKSGQRYLSRGKRTIDDIAILARRLGEAFVYVVRQEKGKPFSVSVMEILGDGGFEWKKKTSL